MCAFKSIYLVANSFELSSHIFFRIEKGSFNLQGERMYDEPPKTWIQKKMRQHTDGKLLDHTTKPLTLLEEERVKLIPEGGDWRDLPNIELRLKDGTCLKKLEYLYKNHNYKNNKYGKERGVCPCMEKEASAECMKSSNQKDTLILWWLVHSGARNNEYAGLYGRVPKDGVFSTVTTDPHPSKKQGRVLHPTQDRVFSVRELARGQGFPDDYRFSGNLEERYRQVHMSHICLSTIYENTWKSFIRLFCESTHRNSL